LCCAFGDQAVTIQATGAISWRKEGIKCAHRYLRAPPPSLAFPLVDPRLSSGVVFGLQQQREAAPDNLFSSLLVWVLAQVPKERALHRRR